MTQPRRASAEAGGNASGTEALWAEQDRHRGDRRRLFSAISATHAVGTVLYPGSFVDIAPSFVFESVTYVDSDERALRFFGDTAGVGRIVDANGGPPRPDISFINADYTTPLDLPDQSFDLLISLYAGFVSEHCTRHLRIGGTLLVNPSHGDAAMASIDPRYRLAGVVIHRSGDYRVSRTDLESYLVPKKPRTITVETLHQSGRGIGYTRSPFAYLFTRIG